MGKCEGLGAKTKKMLLKEFKSLKTSPLRQLRVTRNWSTKNVAQNVFGKLHKELNWGRFTKPVKCPIIHMYNKNNNIKSFYISYFLYRTVKG